MARSKSSNAWLKEHVNDHWVHQAKALGYRSRAAFKLLEIDDKDHFLKSGEVVVDLGASPGGWSQIAARRVAPNGRVLAIDLLEMTGIPGVSFIQGDFREDEALARFQLLLSGASPGVVLSDMAPNISGIAASDQARAMHLAELALEFAVQHLKPEGVFLVKVFQGSGFSEFLQQMRLSFQSVATRKPKASRDRSSEVYLLGRGLK